jgi:nucleotide-binding universal stress UspA family protein
MFQIRRILVPTDFSDASTGALQMAIELAQRFGARITLFHAHQVPSYVFPEGMMPVSPPVLQDLEQSIGLELTRLAAGVESAGVPVDHHQALGVPFAEVCRYAEEMHADLIVMGTHGRTGLRHVLLGSTAEKVVRKAPCPVLTVRPEAHEAARPAR